MVENFTLEEIKRQFKSNKTLRIITFVVGGAIILTVAYLLYAQFVKKPKDKKSQDSYWAAMNLIQKDSTDAAITDLQGQVKKFDGYTGGENAQYLLGRQYMNKGEFKKAIETLEKVDLDDTYNAAMAIGLQGDCYSELKQYKEAFSYYMKAASKDVNEFTTPMYLFKAAAVAEELNDAESALKNYERIQKEFQTFADQNTIDKYIERVSIKKK